MKTKTAKHLFGLWLAAALVSDAPAASSILTAYGPGLDSVTGAGNSFTPSFSGDGRFIVFVSHANNLVTNDSNAMWLDVFVRDLAVGTTTLVSVNRTGVGGGDGNSNFPTISSNGQFIAFESAANNLAGNDTNGVSDIFVRDLAAGTTMLVSVNSDGTASGNKASTAPLISGDGRWVIFESTATNLVAVPTGGTNHLFARDLQSGTTVLVSVNTNGTAGGNGASDSATLSADGRYVAFLSTANDLAPGATNRGGEVYVRDLQAGVTLWISELSSHPADQRCFDPVISAEGRYVAFKAAAGSPAGTTNLYRRALQSPFAGVVRMGPVGASLPVISDDGRFIAYEAPSSPTISPTDVYRWDAQPGVSELVSVHRSVVTSATPGSFTPVMTPDGRHIAFVSGASDLATNPGTGLFVRDMAGANIVLASVNPSSTNGIAGLDLILPAISPDGRFAVFETTSSDLVPNDFNQASDVFARDLLNETTLLISQRHPSRPALTMFSHSRLGPNSASGDGRYLAFTADDGNLFADDTNVAMNVVVRDFLSTTNFSLGGTNRTFNPSLSANGRFVAYEQQAGAYLLAATNVYWHDLQTGGNRLVSAAADATFATPANNSSFGPIISGDARWVVYQSFASDLIQGISKPGGRIDIILRDTSVTQPFSNSPPSYGSNYLVSLNRFGAAAGNGESINPVFSADAQWIVFQSKATDLTTNGMSSAWHQLFARNPFTQQTKLVSSLGATGIGLSEASTGAVISANSRYVAFHTVNSGLVYRHDLLGSSANDLVCTNCQNASISFDGRLVAYESRASGTSPSDVFVKDLTTGSNELISVNRASSGGGNGHSTWPLLSYSGRFVVFTSKASDLADNDTNGMSDVFVRDRIAGATFLISANAQGAGSGNLVSGKPVLASDGRTVVFQSFANDLVPGDYNDRRDIFVLSLAAPDSDGDGLDDDWELAYFNSLARNGGGDLDGDGYTDAQEFLAGTDPTDCGSIFRALTVTFGCEAGGAGFVARVYWASTLGKTYRVQYKNAVTDPWANLPGLITASGPTATAVDTMGFNPAVRRFYRVVLAP